MLQRHVQGGHPAKRRYSTQELKEHDTKRIDIRASVGRLAQHTFWGDRCGTAQEDAACTQEVGLGLPVLRMCMDLEQRAQAKTGELHGELIADEHVGQAQDAMYSTLAMCVVQACCYLLEDTQRLLRGEAALVFEDLSKRGSLGKGCHQVQRASAPTEIIHWRDRWVSEPDECGSFLGQMGGNLVAFPGGDALREVEQRHDGRAPLRALPGQIRRPQLAL